MKNSFNIGGGAIIVIFFIIVSVLLITFVYNTNTQKENFGRYLYYNRSRENVRAAPGVESSRSYIPPVTKPNYTPNYSYINAKYDNSNEAHTRYAYNNYYSRYMPTRRW